MKTFDTTSHQAITRLFDLSRSGETASCEFGQLDSMIYGQLVSNYEAMPDVGALPETAAA